MGPRQNQHVTVFELLELIAAIGLARWTADKLSHRFEGPWENIVFWTTGIAGTLICFLVLMYTVGWLLHWGDRSEAEEPSEESGNEARQ